MYDNSKASGEALSEKFVVRFPPGMRAKIHQVANRARRSMNKEIIARLEYSLANFETISGTGEIVSFLSQSKKDFDRVDFNEEDRAYAEVLLNNKLRGKISELSYEKKRALLKFL